MSAEAEIAALDAALRRRFRVVESEAEIAGRIVSIAHPASAEELISEADFDRDERLPYWAELWPSARVLAAEILAERGDGRSMLELGCGAGLVTTCAALAGFDVTASDYYEDATMFARVNAWRNAHHDATPMMIDWRDLPANLSRFDRVVASDVLYERPYGALVANVIARTLAPDGRATLADPGRVGRELFLAALAPAGLSVVAQRAIPYVNGDIRQTITIFEIAWAS